MIENTETNKKNKNVKKAKVRVFQKKNKGDSEQQLIDKLQAQYESIDVANVKTFFDFPLSENTKRGLSDNNYLVPTDIQKETIGLCLRGNDVLGAAKTGSGKTLAFLIPVLEILYCKQWTRLDGVGALIITPTRELAYQIFETLRKVGVHHDFSAGLIIGGKDLKFEKKRMDQVSIIIGTPGRILQHMDENPLFDCVNMQVLVLDEADRCLDMGFESSMNSIIANLPLKRQTLLFSATQTKSVKDLARLSLKDPSYISVHENSKYSTPENLKQTYAVCELHDKISVVWSFIRNHLKKKIIIFYATCKEVKYIYEMFCKLRPGIPLMALYGSLHQLRRMAIYDDFCQKSNAVLFATDLAARGLDFPKVDWVVQADCPEDAETYIHRVGRTARYNSGGASFLILLPSEEKAMLDKLNEKKIPVENIDVNPLKLQNPIRKMEAFLAKDPSLKETAQRAFVSYIKAVFLMKNKSVFNIQTLNTNAYAHSLGLAIPPRIRFLDRYNKQKSQNKKPSILKENKLNKKIQFEDEDENKTHSEKIIVKVEEVDSENELETAQIKEDIKSEPESSDDEINQQEENIFQATKPDFQVSDDSDEDEGVFTLKRRDHDIDNPLPETELFDFNKQSSKKKPVTKAALAKKILKKNIVPNTKVVFDDTGEKIFSEKEKQSEFARMYEDADEGGIDIETAKLVLQEEDKFDRQRFREKVKAKHKEAKRKLKEQKKKEQEEQDDFGSESEADDVDLSWLPDPDKIYDKNNITEAEFEKNDKEFEEDESISKKQKKKKQKELTKRKIEPDQSLEKPKKKKKRLEEVSSSLTVNEAEELALMLLKNK